jgi:hypothetical protein
LIRGQRPTRGLSVYLEKQAMFENSDLIHSYSRAQAIADGALIDVSTLAREAGIVYLVALTASVWARCVAVPTGVECQDESGRLWDVLFMLALAARQSDGGPEVRFAVHVRRDNREGTPPLVRLTALCGPGGQGEPVITLMMPDEDWPHPVATERLQPRATDGPRALFSGSFKSE